MKHIVLSVILLVFTSCGSAIYSVIPEKITKANVNVGDENTISIGDPVYTSSFALVRKGLEIISMEPFRIGVVNFPYNVGDKLPLRRQNETRWFYSLNPIPGFDIGVSQDKKTGIFRAYQTGMYNNRPEKEIPSFECKEITMPHEDCSKCFKKEFIYNGRVDDGLKFIYREFYGDLIRPSFTQELQYDLSQSDIIGFKGLRVKVINATNSTITYSVLNVFE